MDTFHLTEEQLKALIAEVYSRGIEDGNNADTNSVLKWAEEEACSLTQKNTDPIFDNARKMGNGIAHIMSCKSLIELSVHKGIIPNALLGERHNLRVLDILAEIEKGFREISNYRATIMKSIYPNCMT